ncbi:MAG: hypothetical protein IT438_08685 [Phycisphaerales bacterium]|nr:hypothetical protein [Phycisphaerales bacterium]
MFNVLIRWSIPMAALFILGPIAAVLTHALRAPDGGDSTSLLLNTSIPTAALALLVSLALALGIGILGARYIEQRSGLLAAGIVLAWSAWSLGRIDGILGLTPASSPLFTLAIESAILAIAAVALAFLILRVPTRVPRFIVAGDATRNLAAKAHHEPTAITDPGAIIAVAAAAAGAAVGAWLIAQDFTTGQTFAAAVGGGILAAAAARLTSQRASPAWMFLGVMLVAVAGPIIASFLHPSASGPMRAAMSGTLFPLARPLPMHWLAGAFVGIPLGLWWASSLLEKHEQPATP